MTKFGERIFNSRKKQPDNKKQDDMTKHPESLPEHQEKQTEQYNEKDDAAIERHFKQLPRTERLNAMVHAIERRVGRFNAVLRAGILAAAMTATGCATTPVKINNQLNQKQNYTHERYRKENKRETITALSRLFKDPSRIIRECGGVTEFQENVADTNAPLIMNVAGNHGSLNFVNAETHISQRYTGRCLISIAEENNTEKVIPIGLEFVSKYTDKEDKLRHFLFASLDMEYSFQGDGKRFFGPDGSDNELLNQFPHPIPQNELVDLEMPLLTFIRHFKSEEAAKVLRLFNRENIHLLDREGALDDALSRLMELLHEIEENEDVHFEVVDRHLDKDFSLEDVDFAETVKARDKYLQNKEDGYMSEEDLSTLALKRAEDYDGMFIKREEVAMNTTISLMKDRDIDVGVIVFGSAHPFGDNAAKAGANLLRFETAGANMHHGIITHDVTRFAGFEIPKFSVENMFPTTVESMQHWVMGKGGREIVRNLIKNGDGGHYQFFFRNVHLVQSVFKFSQDEMFSIIYDGMADLKHLLAHGRYNNIEEFRDYLSAEQFASLQKEIPEECEEHIERSKEE